MGVEFVEEYWVEYSRDFGQTWIKWRNKKGAHLLHGNINTFDVKRNVFDVPIVGANMVRIVPFSQYLRTVCLRFELFGCPFEGKRNNNFLIPYIQVFLSPSFIILCQL